MHRRHVRSPFTSRIEIRNGDPAETLDGSIRKALDDLICEQLAFGPGIRGPCDDPVCPYQYLSFLQEHKQ